VVQQWCDRTQSVSPLKMVVVPLTRKSGIITYLLTYLHTYVLTYLLTAWSRVLCEKLTGFQQVKKFPTFCGTRMFITAFTSANLCEHFVTR
jgi:hypothetical protein